MPKYTNQSAFELVVRHLASQEKPSWSEDDYTCAYRGDDGGKCAVGALIPDDEWEAFAKRRADYFPNSFHVMEVAPHIPSLGDLDLRLLKALQDAHDRDLYRDDGQFMGFNRLREIAKSFNLEDSVVDEVVKATQEAQ